MMHGREKSDLAIVAMKPANKANEPTAEASTGANAAEPVERRAGTKGNAERQSTHWTQSQARVSQALDRMRQTFCRLDPRWDVCGKAARTDLCGGRAMKPASWSEIRLSAGAAPSRSSSRNSGLYAPLSVVRLRRTAVRMAAARPRPRATRPGESYADRYSAWRNLLDRALTSSFGWSMHGGVARPRAI